MKWIFIILTVIILVIFIIARIHKKQWIKFLGYEITTDEMNIISSLESLKFSKDKIKNMINDYKKGFLDKSTIEAIVRYEKAKIEKEKKEAKELEQLIEYKNNTYKFNREIKRTLDITYQSLHIAIKSKKLETLESRINIAIDCFNELKTMNSYFVKAIENEYNELLKEAYTAKYLNIAQVYYDKSETLKTEKTRQKYFDMSKEHLLNGLKDIKANQEKINQKYQELFGRVETEIIDNKNKV